jgi:hypothetical protein
MAMLHTEFDENNVAGDDGLDVTPYVDHTLEVVSLLGTVENEKTFRQSEGCCIHLKRPIMRVGARLFHGGLVTWPSLEPGQIEQDVDSRYSYLKRVSNRERKDMIASSITAFLRKLERLTLDDRELNVIDTFISDLYKRFDLPREGCVPQITHELSGFVPIYEKRYIGLDPIYNTISRTYTNIATLPLRRIERVTVDMLRDDVFECNQGKLLKHLTILGYIEQESLTCQVFGYDGLQLLLKEYIRPDPTIYRFKVIRKLPDWINDIVF